MSTSNSENVGKGKGGNPMAPTVNQLKATFYARFVKTGTCKRGFALVSLSGSYPLLERVNSRGLTLYLSEGQYIGTPERDTRYKLSHAAAPPEWSSIHLSNLFHSSRSNVGYFDVRGTSDGGLLILDRDVLSFEVWIIPQGKASAALYARLLEQADPKLVEQLDALRRAATPPKRGTPANGEAGLDLDLGLSPVSVSRPKPKPRPRLGREPVKVPMDNIGTLVP